MNPELEKLYTEFPHLRGKSKAEIKRQTEANNKAMFFLDREERRAEAEKLAEQINAAMASVVDGLRLLEQHGFLNDEIRQAHTSSAGIFTPHLKYKNVDADRILNKQSAETVMSSPKKTRRKKA